MMKMQEETQAVYQKYGVSATGSCVQLAIQLPILFASVSGNPEHSGLCWKCLQCI